MMLIYCYGYGYAYGYLMTTAQCGVQDFVWLVTLPVVDIMEHE
jgi:hypothetical protein